MSKKNAKTAVVAFKVETELADILNQLPNKVLSFAKQS